MLSNDQPLGRAGFEAVGSLGLIDTPNDPLALDAPSSADASACLSDFVDGSRPRPSVDDVLNWGDQLLDAIHQLHTQPRPVIHGAIAPSSARINGKTISLLPSTDVSETDANVSFKPLEQMWEGLDHVTHRVILNPLDEKAQNSLLKDPSPASDIYSVGATMYAVATGTVPPDALDRTIAAMEGKADPLVHPSELVPSIPTEIGDAIVKAMSLRREERPFSAVILRQVFRTATVKIQERLASEPASEPDLVVAPPEPTNTQQENADADHARQLAYKILAEKTAVGQNDEILDLGAAESDPAEHIESSPSVVAASPVAEFAEDEVVEIAPVESQESSHVLDPYTDITPSFLEAAIQEETPRSSSKGLAIGVAAAAVVIAVIVGFFVFSSRTSAPPAPTSTAAAELPVAAPQPSTETPAQTQAEPEQAADITSSAPEAADSTPHEKNTRAAVTPAQDKTKKPAKPAPTKKQVTVDDLINDN